MGICVITGIRNEMGLGQALARKWSGEGHTVIATAREQEPPEYYKSFMAKSEGRLLYHRLDLTSTESVKKLAEDVIREHGGIDFLINNATATNKYGNLPIFDDGFAVDETMAAFNVNVLGFIRLVKSFMPNFNEGAMAVAISSEAGSMGDNWRDYNLDYGGAKAALNFCCVTIQRALYQREIGERARVLAIHPGWVQTHPAPPKADLTPDQSAGAIYNLVLNPPEFDPKTNAGVYLNADGTPKAF